MNEEKLQLRGKIYLIASLSMLIPAIIGASVFTFFFIIGEWNKESVGAYAGILILCILIAFTSLLLYGASRTYLKGPSPERDELEQIRKETEN
tara:strand:- start:5394 stop:5672 length:279 start_codon:yes stop_codon:yes gene_type:complete